MNLITDCWLQAINHHKEIVSISPLDISNPTLRELWSPRPDFRGAHYQFLIGLLQTCFSSMLDDFDDWEDLWVTAPTEEKLREVFSRYSGAFEFDCADGPAFMQDFDVNLAVDKEKPIAYLLVDQPTDNTLKNNQDLFIKRNQIKGFCAPCSASALFAWQLTGVSAGKGHRVGVRGGGPLTTLLLPQGKHVSLWQRLWINVVVENERLKNKDKRELYDIFPWLAPTNTSERDEEMQPSDAHPLQAYWAMPHRIRFQHNKVIPGDCDCCGQQSDTLYTHYKMKNYGVNYAGPWIHPLTPYQTKKNSSTEPPNSIKGKKGALGYTNWLGLVFSDSDGKTRHPAAVVYNFHKKIGLGFEGNNLSLWCFGYDMDKAKSRCWHEDKIPFFSIQDEKQREILIGSVKHMVDRAYKVEKALSRAIKETLRKNSKSGKVDGVHLHTLSSWFYKKTQENFFEHVENIRAASSNEKNFTTIIDSWSFYVSNKALDLFDKTVLSFHKKGARVQAMVEARVRLDKNLKKHKRGK